MIGNDEPIIYPINSPKIVIGSAEGADIVISSQGISRKHIILLSENDSYFIVDQGSTNGSYVNEERLVPGRKVEFTSFFPVRLGHDVLLSLLSDEEEISNLIEIPTTLKPAKKEIKNDSTRVISLKELQGSAKTDKLIRSLNEKKAFKKSAGNPKETSKKKNKNWTPYIALGFFISVAIYNIYFSPKISETESQPILERPGKEVVVKKKAPKIEKLIPQDELVPIEKLTSLLADLKCITENEKLVCDKLELKEEWGVSQIGLTFFIMAGVDDSLMKAQEILKTQEDSELLREVVMGVYLAKILELYPDFTGFQNVKIYVSLFKKDQNTSAQFFVGAAFYPHSFLKLKNRLSLGSLSAAQNGGMDALLDFKKYYRTLTDRR